MRCACNSRLNLVRLFVSPPHPTRARTPPWGCLCARLSIPACACARPVVYSCVRPPVRAVRTPGYLPVRAVRLAACARGCALPFPWVRLSVRGALASFAACSVRLPVCSRCSVRSVLTCFASDFPLDALAVPALPYAGRLARCGYRCCSPLASLVVVRQLFVITKTGICRVLLIT